MASPIDLARMVPGFDFLQGLMKTAGTGLPNMSQWVAPTLDPAELDKRIQELKTVQFWLDQNSRLLGTTIQAMEVQRMTLSTLQNMNLPLADIGNALKLKPLGGGTEAAATAPTVGVPLTTPKVSTSKANKANKPKAAKPSAPEQTAAAAPALADPLQWWGALTQQFSELAAKAVKDSAADAGKNLAGAMVKQSIDTATGLLKQATGRKKAAKAKPR